MNKGLKRRVLTALFAVLACSFLVGSFTVSAAGNYLPEDFFAVEGGEIGYVEENYDAGATTGTHVFIMGTDPNNGTATLKYKDALDVADLGNAVTFQVLPEKDGEVDFDGVQVILRDSADPDQLISVLVERSASWDTSPTEPDAHTSGYVSLEENLSRVNEDYEGGNIKEGMVRLGANIEQFVYALDNIAGEGYSQHGTMNLGTWGTIYPLLASRYNEETQTSEGTKAIAVGYSNSVVSVNGVTIADLKNDTWQSASVDALVNNEAAYGGIIAKYTDEYIDNLFSSGKVTVELKFINVKKSVIEVNIANIGGTNLAKPYENNFESQAEYTEGAPETVVGTKIPMATSATVLGKAAVADLAEPFEFQLLPNGVGNDNLAAENVLITFRDSVDSSQTLTVIIEKSTLWDSVSLHPAAFVSLEENTARKDNYGYRGLVANSDQNVVGYDGWQKTGYTAKGTIYLGVWGSYFPYLGVEADGRYTKPITITYAEKEVQVNGYKVANLNDADYRATSTEELDPVKNADIIAKYTDDYINNLFSSGEVYVEIRFDGTFNGSVNVLSLGGQSAANLQIGEDVGAKDTLAPVITAISGDTYDAKTNTFTVEKDTQYTVSELAAITAADVMDPAPVTGIEVYNKDGVQYETAAVTFAEGDYVILYAVDADGNRSEVRASVAFAGAQTTYTVTYTDGSGTNATVAEGETYTFAAAEQAGKSFAGWVINGKLYPANYETAVTENLEVSALFLSFATGDAELAGEGIIRWYTRIGAEDHAALTALADVRFGTLITCDSKAGYLDIATNVWAVEGAEYRAAFTDIPAEMYGASFTGTGYAIVAYENGVSAVVYASGSTVSVDGLSA